MSSVNTDPKDLRRLSSDIQRAQADISTAIKRVRSSLNGAHWNDPVRKRFEQQLAEMESAINRFGQTAQESQRYLAKKAGELETFLRS
jgi:ABC-type transporter Mla subunit MlaD